MEQQKKILIQRIQEINNVQFLEFLNTILDTLIGRWGI